MSGGRDSRRSGGKQQPPVLILDTTVTAIASGTTGFSTAIDCRGYDWVAIYSTCDQSHVRQVQASVDGITWCNVVSGGLLPSTMSFTGGAGVSVCQIAPASAFLYVRVSLANNGGVACVAKVYAVLGR